jgi:hypothetical protein
VNSQIDDNVINNIAELFNTVHDGISVVHNRVDIWNVDGKDVEKLTKVWQIERVSEFEYCYKTFDGWGKGIKHLFFMDSSKSEKPIIDYYDNFRNALCNIMASVYGDEETLEKLATEDLLSHNGHSLNYTNIELLDDRKNNRLYKYRFTSFKTRQTVGSNKSGELAIREVLNKHIEKSHPDGIRRDEYMTSNSRADSIVFNKDSIHIYEIKSEKDSFARLESQIEDYKKYADRITIVIHSKKMPSFITKHSHKYKGIEVLIYYSADRELKQISRSKVLNPTTDKMSLLWKEELYSNVLGFISGLSKLSQYNLVPIASAVFTKKQACEIANEILHNRHKTTDEKGRMRNGAVDMFLIFNKYKLESSILQDKANIALKRLAS